MLLEGKLLPSSTDETKSAKSKTVGRPKKQKHSTTGTKNSVHTSTSPASGNTTSPESRSVETRDGSSCKNDSIETSDMVTPNAKCLPSSGQDTSPITEFSYDYIEEEELLLLSDFEAEPIMSGDDFCVHTSSELHNKNGSTVPEKPIKKNAESSSKGSPVSQKDGVSTNSHTPTDKNDQTELKEVSGSGGDVAEKEDDAKDVDALFMKSMEHVLQDISDIKALETRVVHFELGYMGTFDCVAKYK